MEAEDIESRDFFVGMRGYDREEVDQFLAEIAADHRALLAELEEIRNRPPVEKERDSFEDLGADVTAILRAATKSAADITDAAEEESGRTRDRAQAEAIVLRREADDYAAKARDSADAEVEETRNRSADIVAEAERTLEAARAESASLVENANADAASIVEQARAEAEKIVERALAEATGLVEQAGEERYRIVAEAEARIPDIEADAERRGLERAHATADAAVARLADATKRHEGLRARLAETSDEIQLALMALGDPITDAAAAVQDAIAFDGAGPAANDEDQERVTQEG